MPGRRCKCALPECDEIIESRTIRGRPKKYCCRNHQEKAHRRSATGKASHKRRRIRLRSSVLGRICKWCESTDEEVISSGKLWSSLKDCCAKCDRQMRRNPCPTCGGPFYIGNTGKRGCLICDELTIGEKAAFGVSSGVLTCAEEGCSAVLDMGTEGIRKNQIGKKWKCEKHSDRVTCGRRCKWCRRSDRVIRFAREDVCYTCEMKIRVLSCPKCDGPRWVQSETCKFCGATGKPKRRRKCG